MAIAPPPYPVPAVDPCEALLLDDARLSRFAMEVARDVYAFPVICAQYGITEELFNEKICNSVQFIRYYAEHRVIWNSPISATQRIAAKAGVMVEDFLSKLDKILHDDSVNASTKIDAFKYLGKISGVENVNPPPERGQPGQMGQAGATVVINLNHGRQITIEPKDVTDVEELPTQVNQPPVINMPSAQQQERAALALRQAMGLAPPPMPPGSENRWGAGRGQVATAQDNFERSK